jgi:hypothetical protein
MRRNISISVLTAAMMLSGLLVGIAYGNSDGITEPRTIELNTGHCGGPAARCRFYGLKTKGRVDGQILTVNGPMLDVDDSPIGRFRETCTYEGWNANICTQVFSIKAGAHTDPGTVVTTGILGEWIKGLNGDFAITGGTGAYANARGHATKVYDGTDFIFTLYLTP